MLPRRTFALLVAAGWLLPRVPAAATGGGRIDLVYDLAVNGFRVAQARCTIDDDGTRVESRLTITTVGLVSLVRADVTRMSGSSRWVGGQVVPQQYDALQEKSDRTRRLAVTYDASGEVAGATHEARGKAAPIEVPPEQRLGTVDPLTGVARLRQWVLAGAPGDQLLVPVFDGRKRYDYQASPLERGGGRVRRLHVDIVARVGFSGKDALVTYPGQSGGRWLDIRLADDQRAAPQTVRTVNAKNLTTLTLRA